MRSLFLSIQKAFCPKVPTTYESWHLERDGNNVKIVSDGVSDRQKEVESHRKEAGLDNILKQQALRYGSIDNAIVRNESRKVFADVSNIPDTVGEQAEQVKKVNADVSKLCEKLGITKDQLLALTPEKYLEIRQAQAAALAAQQGGNE